MIHTRLKEWHPDRLRCSIDPVTLTGLALGAAGGGLASLMGGGGSSAPAAASAAPAPTPPPAAAPPSAPQGTKATPKPAQFSTFLGAAAAPPTQSGSKTLLGQ